MPQEKIIHASADDFAALIAGDQPVLVDFWASWCGPCRMIGPFIEQLAEEFDGRAVVCKVNVDEQPALAQQYGIVSIPSILVFKNGELLERSTGAKPKHLLAQMLEKNI